MAATGHREALLDAAKRLLRERGYVNTTARDLVAASDTNLGSIGYHFGSKEALLNEALSELFVDWTRRMTGAASDPSASALERAGLSWREMLDAMADDRPLLQAFVDSLSPALRSPELRAQLAESYRATRREVAGVVAEALGADAVGAGADPEIIASFFIAVADGYVLQFLVDPSSCPSGDELVGALGSALAALAPGAATAP